LSLTINQDPWLGTIEHFPTVLHARASLVYDVNPDTLQRILVHSLYQLQQSSSSIELSIADYPGSIRGIVGFKAGIGNLDGFDTLDRNEEERVLRRIVERGPFQTLDFALDLHYKTMEGGHRVRNDRYLTRASFQPGRVELLIHHLKGLRRVQPDELVQFLLALVNTGLAEKGYSEIEMEAVEAE
jgi:hypothetical protein